MRAISLTRKQSEITGIILIILAFLLFVFSVYIFLPVHENANPPETWGWGVDWKNNIREGALDLIHGETPYIRVNKCFPPWAYLLVAPIALLPPALGTAMMFVLSYMGYAFVLFRMKSNIWVILAFMLNRFIFVNAQNGNLDFLAVIGFVLPPQIGLFFVLIKPQIGAGIALFWLIETWRKGKLKEVVRVFAPVTIAYLISFLLYGLWPLRLIGMPDDPYNASLWPYAIPIGLILLYFAIRNRKSLFAMSATPFLVPYTNISSFSVILFAFTQNLALMIVGSVLSWIPPSRF